MRRLRRYATATVIAIVPLAIMCAAMTYLLNPKPKPMALDFNLTTAINESSTTVGMADSDLYGMSEADIIATFNEMQSLGVDTVRVLVPWGDIHKVPPGDPLEFFYPPYWDKVDFIVEQAMSRNMAVLGVLNSTPYWGGENGSGCIGCYGAAPDPTKFAAFAAEATTHLQTNFPGVVSAYEVWNEPNYVASWSPTIDPIAYTNLLKAAYSAIKEANDLNGVVNPDDPLVVGGVLGSSFTFANITYDTVDFVEQMYANGAQGFFDALSYHPYQYTTEFSQGTVEAGCNYLGCESSPINQLLAIRQLMIDQGDSALRIWATEYGLPTGGPNAVTEEQQAAFIEDFLNTWHSFTFTGPAFIYTTRDRDLVNGVLTEDGSFGLFKYDLTTLQWVEKQAADIVRDWIAAHQEPTTPPGPGPTDPISQLAAALQAFFDQIQAAVQNFVNSVNAFFNAITQALTNIFNPGGAAATAVPAGLQDDVADATMMAARSFTADASTSSAESSEPDGANSVPEDVSATENAGTETVSETEATETTEAATDQSTSGQSADPGTADQETTEAEATETEEASTETKTSETSTVSTDQKVADTEKVTTDDAKKAESTETKTPTTSAESDTNGASTGSVTGSESREPERTGVVARPAKVGEEGAGGSGDSATAGATAGATTGGTTTG